MTARPARLASAQAALPAARRLHAAEQRMRELCDPPAPLPGEDELGAAEDEYFDARTAFYEALEAETGISRDLITQIGGVL